MKKLYRSKENKIIAGVLGGFAEYFEHDPVAWRIGAVILFILTGFMPLVLVYVILWAIIPVNPGVAYTVEKDEVTHD